MNILNQQTELKKKNMKNFANIRSEVPTRWLHLPSFACRGQAANRICLYNSKEDNLDLELLWLSAR